MASGNRPAPADKTAQKQQIGRPFEPGQSGNPAGRPKGSRNKLSEAFLQALAEDFEANGKEVVEKVRAERPQDYLKIIVAVMPTRTEIEKVVPARRAEDMTDDELVAIIDEARAEKQPQPTLPPPAEQGH